MDSHSPARIIQLSHRLLVSLSLPPPKNRRKTGTRKKGGTISILIYTLQWLMLNSFSLTRLRSPIDYCEDVRKNSLSFSVVFCWNFFKDRRCSPNQVEHRRQSKRFDGPENNVQPVNEFNKREGQKRLFSYTHHHFFFFSTAPRRYFSLPDYLTQDVPVRKKKFFKMNSSQLKCREKRDRGRRRQRERGGLNV